MFYYYGALHLIYYRVLPFSTIISVRCTFLIQDAAHRSICKKHEPEPRSRALDAVIIVEKTRPKPGYKVQRTGIIVGKYINQNPDPRCSAPQYLQESISTKPGSKVQRTAIIVGKYINQNPYPRCSATQYL